MYLISPWSRGGWVNSQVFDHTSVIRFIEQRFGVMEPNISPWRRAVCGDLCSAFDFTTHDASPFLPMLPDPAPRAALARQLAATTLPSAPAEPAWPLQAAGEKRSRALPYLLRVTEEVRFDQQLLELMFINDGDAGAVFHVYDLCALAAVPRRYTVEPGKRLAGTWPFAGAAMGYDLWVLGPNGFHRRIAGSAAEAILTGTPQVRLAYDRAAGTVSLRLLAPASSAFTFRVAANAYGHKGAALTVAAGGAYEQTWELAESGYWYDLSVTVAEQPAFKRRFAGRLETGRDSISDPAMGGVGLVS